MLCRCVYALVDLALAFLIYCFFLCRTCSFVPWKGMVVPEMFVPVLHEPKDELSLPQDKRKRFYLPHKNTKEGKGQAVYNKDYILDLGIKRKIIWSHFNRETSDCHNKWDQQRLSRTAIQQIIKCNIFRTIREPIWLSWKITIVPSTWWKL